MTGIIAFLALLLLVGGYAVWRGGAPERAVAALFLVATLASALAPWERHTTYRSVHWWLLGIDAALLFSLLIVTVCADRFWPIWLSALQLVAVASHGARGYDPTLVALSYWWILGKISYPMLAILSVGTFRYRTRRNDGRRQFAWTVQRRKWQRAARDEGGTYNSADVFRARR